jgi:hypothetical protein
VLATSLRASASAQRDAQAAWHGSAQCAAYGTFGMQRLIFSAKYRVLVRGGCSLDPKFAQESESGLRSRKSSAGKKKEWRKRICTMLEQPEAEWQLLYFHMFEDIVWCAAHPPPSRLPKRKHALSQLCSVMSKPSEKAWNLALHTLKWLSANASVGLQYNTARVTGYDNMQFAPAELHVYHDSGHNQFDDGRAQYGNALMLAGGAVSFVSKKHSTVGDSTCCNEYMSGYHAAKRAKEAKNLLLEIGGAAAALVSKPIKLCGDNDAATSIATERRPARHIELKYHYTRELVRQEDVVHVRVPSKSNRADIQTKGVVRPVFRHLAPLLKGIYED